MFSPGPIGKGVSLQQAQGLSWIRHSHAQGRCPLFKILRMSDVQIPVSTTELAISFYFCSQTYILLSANLKKKQTLQHDFQTFYITKKKSKL